MGGIKREMEFEGGLCMIVCVGGVQSRGFFRCEVDKVWMGPDLLRGVGREGERGKRGRWEEGGEDSTRCGGEWPVGNWVTRGEGTKEGGGG